MGRGYGHYKVGDEKGKGDQRGLCVCKLAGGFQKRYQCTIEPSDEPKDEKQSANKK